MTDLKQQAIEIFLRTLEAIDIKALFDARIHVEGDVLFAGKSAIDLTRYDEIVAIGLGKASIKMGRALIEALGDRVTRGVLVTGERGDLEFRSSIEVLVGGHPVPTEGSLRAGERLLELAGSCGARSLIIFLISGGGSALAESLASPNVTLEDLKKLNRILITCGANIEEINTIRKRISKIKGGGLGSRAFLTGARSLAIYVSDVNAGDLRSIASNPVLPEPPARERALRIVAQYRLAGKLPTSILSLLESPVAPQRSSGDQSATVETVLLCDNGLAIEAAGRIAEDMGFLVKVCEDLREGGYKEIAEEMIKRLSELRNQFQDRAICLISGGEVSCVVSGNGVGGRNQEFVLYSATKLAEQWIDSGTVAVLSCGTDGIDGNSPAAGAVSDPHSIATAKASGTDPGLYLRENDSFSFFSKLGGLVLTGPTGTNVRDIRILVSAPGD